jgi:transcriptional regulator with XRE-family HTH domain
MGKLVSSAMVRVGARLRAHREAAGLTQIQLCELLHLSDSWLSQVETGQKRPEGRKLMEIVQALHLSPEALAEIMDLLMRETPEGKPAFDKLIEAEQRATVIRDYELALIPGLLQTPEYARALIGASPRFANLEERIAARMARQEILRRDDPPRLWVLLDEMALRRTMGGDDVHRAQLDVLIQASQRPETTILVIPFATAARAGLAGNFRIMSFSDAGDIAYSEDPVSGRFVEHADTVRRYLLEYDTVRDAALPIGASQEFIRQVREEL